MRILSVNNPLDTAFRDLGHDVVSLSVSSSGIYSLHTLTDVAGFQPQMFLQRETLGLKICFQDIHELSCVKGFWSIDTHLNYYWQRYYGQLFDVFFTPHPTYLSCLGENWRHPHMQRMPQPARELPWVPHAQRTHTSCFVGRQTAYRALRERMCTLLQDTHQMEIFDGLTNADMFALYSNTRLIPNECIAFESNFRLLEGAACGCCVLSPVIGEDQDALFTPGKEILVYNDAAELLSLMDYYTAHPAEAEAVGQAAHSRVQAEHLPRHRARVMLEAMLEAMPRAPRTAAQGNAATQALVMAMAQLCLNEQVTMSDMDALFTQALDTINELRLRVLFTVKRQQLDQLPALLQCARQALAQAESAEHTKALAIACGGAAIYARDKESAQYFLNIYECVIQCAEQDAADLTVVADRWITALIRDGKLLVHGLLYCEGCCHSALDMILTLAEIAPVDDTWARHMHSMACMRQTLPYLDMTAVARLSLNNPDSLEYSLDYIAIALKCFDMQTAEKERLALLDLARQRGMEQTVQSMLSRLFPYWQTNAGERS